MRNKGMMTKLMVMAASMVMVFTLAVPSFAAQPPYRVQSRDYDRGSRYDRDYDRGNDRYYDYERKHEKREAVKRTVIGALLGAGGGGLLGGRKGAAIGAVIGGAGGYIYHKSKEHDRRW